MVKKHVKPIHLKANPSFLLRSIVSRSKVRLNTHDSFDDQVSHLIPHLLIIDPKLFPLLPQRVQIPFTRSLIIFKILLLFNRSISSWLLRRLCILHVVRSFLLNTVIRQMNEPFLQEFLTRCVFLRSKSH